MAAQTVTEFLGIHLENSLEPGKLRMASTGLGWKGDMQGVATTVAAGDMKWMQWLRVGRGFQLRIGLKSERRRITFEGFPRDDHERLKNTASHYYNITLEDVETSVRGWNWGTSEVRGNDLAFLVQGKHAFTVPLRNVHNTSINKQEVALEFRDEAMIKEVERLSAAQDKESRKLRRTAPDECVEIRFYIPGTVGAAKRRQKAAKKEAAEADGTGAKQKGKGKGVKKEGEDGDVTMDGEENGEGEDDDDDATTGSEAEGEDQAAAENFFESIKDKTDVGQHTGDTLVAFPDVLCTTPRGRFDIDMFPDFLRLRGKTYDYKILYSSIVKLFLLPKVDDIHVQFVVNLEPPIRQGQTRYPYLIMQFTKEEEMDAEIQMDEEELKQKYDGKLDKKYEAPAYEVVSTIFKVFSGKKVTSPGSFQSHAGHSAVKANFGATEGYIFLLEKSFLFISKAPLFLPYADINEVRFERVSGALTSSARTFDLIVQMKAGKQEHTFSAVSKEEQGAIEEFLKRDKKLRVKNIIEENLNAVNSELVAAMMDEDSDDDDAPKRGGGDDEDEDSEVDEDFKAPDSGDEDDVAEEYDENAGSSDSSDSDDSDAGGDSDDDDDDDDDAMEEDSPEKKKAEPKKSKTSGGDAEGPAKKKQKKAAD